MIDDWRDIPCREIDWYCLPQISKRVAGDLDRQCREATGYIKERYPKEAERHTHRPRQELRGEQAVNETREAKVHLTVRAGLREMFDAAREVGLHDHVSHDPPIDDDDPADVRTCHISYGDHSRPEHEPDLGKIWALLAQLGDRAEVWISMSDGAIHAEAYLPGRKAEIRVHSETLGGELGRRIQKAIAVLIGDAE